MSDVFEVAALQDLDDGLTRVEADIASLQGALARNEAVDNARRQLEHVRSRIQQGEKVQRRLEGEIADLTARIEPEEKRLFSGSVTSTKELMGIQQEVDQLKEKRRGLEDDQLQTMDRLDKMAPREAAAQRDLEAALAARETEEADLRARLALAEAEQDRLREQRAGQVGKVPAASLRAYDDLRRRKGGTVVARLKGVACGACRVTLPDVVRKQAMAGESLVQCPNCDKIIVPG